MDDWDHMSDEDLDQFALTGTRDAMQDEDSGVREYSSLMLADGLLYAVGVIAVMNALFEADMFLFFCGAGLWLCSQSINRFRRLLPLWLRAAMNMEIDPTDWAILTPQQKKRRIVIVFVAAVLSGLTAWRFTVGFDEIATRSGVPFHLVIFALTGMLALLGLHWVRLLMTDEGIYEPVTAGHEEPWG